MKTQFKSHRIFGEFGKVVAAMGWIYGILWCTFFCTCHPVIGVVQWVCILISMIVVMPMYVPRMYEMREILRNTYEEV